MNASIKSHSEDVRIITVTDIIVGNRIRKEQGNIKELAENIEAFGLMNPITVVRSEKNSFRLVAGYRRLCAMKYLGRDHIMATVLPELQGDDRLLMEISENEIRKNFTVSERLEYALQLKEIEAEKAKLRQITHTSSGYVKNNPAVTGAVRDIVAKKTGFGSGRTLNRAIFVAKNRPDLLDKIDRKELSVMGAYQIARGNEESDENIYTSSKALKLPPLFVPEEIKVSGVGINGATHDELLQNPVYHILYDRYMELVKVISQMNCDARETRRIYEADVRNLKQQLKDAKSKSAQRGEVG